MGYSFQTSSKKERLDLYNPECTWCRIVLELELISYEDFYKEMFLVISGKTGKAVLFYRLSPKKVN
jgi:hypothetical protein